VSPPLRHVDAHQVGDVTCISLKKHRLSEDEIQQIAEEVVGLIDGGCRKLVLSLGPGALQCLYSVFLSKLVMFQRLLREHGGSMKLCDVTPEVRGVFEACRLYELFEFAPDRESAVASFGEETA
jgi:anti-anti-sigma factor